MTPPQDQSGVQDDGDPQIPLQWDPGFAGAALVVALVAAGGGVGLLLGNAPPWPKLTSLKKQPEPELVFASQVALVLLSVAIVLLVAGVWLIAVETRGRMRTAEQVAAAAATAAQQREARLRELGPVAALKVVIESVGKLRGSVAVIVVGLVPLVLAAWIAGTALDPGAEPVDEASDDSTETPSASDSPTAGASDTPLFSDTPAPGEGPATGDDP